MNIGLIGNGAIARCVMGAIEGQGHRVSAILLRPERVAVQTPPQISAVADIPAAIDLMIDCAGHSALAHYGPAILARGIDMITVSLGALADPVIAQNLEDAAAQGGSRLHLASGAIGALDCLSAANIGTLHRVAYTGRKPPHGWKGSAAEASIDLDAMTQGDAVHFEGTARDAALRYTKNANVAAAVALAGLGFDDTEVRLIADATITQNIHEISAEGAFGQFQFQISGNALPDNPRSSALAAMSVVSKLDQITRRVTF
ncbi:MAG: aspartate dehydrogenase [Pseudomonadota bacterium]